MERIQHIKETQRKDLLEAQTDVSEADPMRDRIIQADKYDKSTEVAPAQIRIREYINSFDEQVLKDIFSEHFRKSGSDETTMNWISFDDVRIVDNQHKDSNEPKLFRGSHSVRKGIELYTNKLSDDQERTLWTLIHEECHAISTNLAQFKTLRITGEWLEEIGRVPVFESGVSKSYSQNGVVKDIFDDINEGITEFITERVFREYKKRTGTDTYSEDATNPERNSSEANRTVATKKFDAYKKYWQTAKIYIDLVSAISDVPEDVVENAIIRTYIRNGEILSREIEWDFEDSCAAAIGGDIMSLLTRMDEDGGALHRRLDSLASNYYRYDEDGNEIPRENLQKIRERIYRAFQKVKGEWVEAYKLAPNVV